VPILRNAKRSKSHLVHKDEFMHCSRESSVNDRLN
jgi:hypothetical protein